MWQGKGDSIFYGLRASGWTGMEHHSGRRADFFWHRELWVNHMLSAMAPEASSFLGQTFAAVFPIMMSMLNMWTWRQRDLALRWNRRSTALANQSPGKIISDGAGGIIVRSVTAQWQFRHIDSKRRSLRSPWRCQRTRCGVRDIANDQGGRVRLFWNPSPLDVWPNPTIRSYAIQVGVRLAGVVGVAGSAAMHSGMLSAAQGPDQIYWQTVDSVRAGWLGAYSAVVPTSLIRVYREFQVLLQGRRAGTGQERFWNSNVDSGYSVDNIPPVGIREQRSVPGWSESVARVGKGRHRSGSHGLSGLSRIDIRFLAESGEQARTRVRFDVYGCGSAGGIDVLL